MNIVFIMTDTQNKSMVGAYGNPAVDTPNLDRLSDDGICFERAYTTCPLCTPARGAIFSGLNPQVNGAWCNNISPHSSVPLMGTIFSHFGLKTAYTGKWHLDGIGYFGNGVPQGGFMPDYWYDGKRYADDLGPEMFAKYMTCHTPEQLRAAGFTEEHMWGHRVADRAVDFLNNAGDEPFLLAVSFDEPHHPCLAPPEYWEKFQPEDIPRGENYYAPLTDKPRMQHIQREQQKPTDINLPPGDKFYGCNSYIDREISRVVDAVRQNHWDDTIIIYTSDHGDMQGGHGLWYKGPQMYQETTNVPFIVRYPGGPGGAVSHSLVSHLDILPTLLDLSGLDIPEAMQGASFLPVLKDPRATARDNLMISFHRFSINFDIFGSYYPIRCAVDGRYKLSINLIDTDELYDLVNDPHEMHNLIDDPEHAEARDRLHDYLLMEMDRIRDPYRSFQWGERSWRSARRQAYIGADLTFRNLPDGFPFEAECIHADGSRTNKR